MSRKIKYKNFQISYKIKLKVGMVANIIGGEYKVTRSGVPIIIKKTNKTTFSIVYVSKEDKWKAFYPWPSSVQEKIYFESLDNLIEFFNT